MVDVMTNGTYKGNRTGIGTYAKQHQYFFLKDVKHNFPILRGKKMFPKMVLKELIWMLLGRTDLEWLRNQKVTYWDEWELEDGTIGPSYGHQYRNFNGVDQLQELINEMLKNPLGRRHIISLWNPVDLPKMALPPCMYDFHFSCTPADKADTYKVDLHSHLRSNDSFLGAPYDFMFCGFFVILLCDFLNRKAGTEKYIPGDVHYTADDWHIYENHLTQGNQYVNNVIENKDDVINARSECILDFPETMTGDDPELLDIDSYLKYVIRNHKSGVNVVWHKTTDFEYPTIKADIAV